MDEKKLVPYNYGNFMRFGEVIWTLYTRIYEESELRLLYIIKEIVFFYLSFRQCFGYHHLLANKI